MKISELLEKNKKATKKKATRKVAGKVALGVSVGTAVGLAAGTLLAPKSGKETREQLVKGAKDAVEKAKVSVEEVKEKITARIEKKEETCCCGEGNTSCEDKSEETTAEASTKE